MLPVRECRWLALGDCGCECGYEGDSELFGALFEPDSGLSGGAEGATLCERLVASGGRGGGADAGNDERRSRANELGVGGGFGRSSGGGAMEGMCEGGAERGAKGGALGEYAEP